MERTNSVYFAQEFPRITERRIENGNDFGDYFRREILFWLWDFKMVSDSFNCELYKWNIGILAKFNEIIGNI